MSILAKTNGWMISGLVIGESNDSIIFQPNDSKLCEIIPKDSKTEKIFEDGYIACNWIDINNNQEPTFPEYPNEERLEND